VVIMGILMVSLSFSLYSWSIIRWVVAGIIMAYVSSAHAFSGFDNLELVLHGRQILPPHSSTSPSSSSDSSGGGGTGKDKKLK
jgi:ABC-type molybdate transport system permease subunit